MTPSEYLDEAKKTIGITSDYELAKRLEINRGWITGMRDGSRNIPVDVTFRLAITLNLDPAMVLADLEAQREKNPKRLEFWRSFLSRAAVVAIMACTLAWSSSATFAPAGAALGGLIAANAALYGLLRLRRVRIIVIM